MRCKGFIVIAALTLVSMFACATNQNVPRSVQLKQEVVIAIEALDVLAKSVEAAAVSTPPLLTLAQANSVLDEVKAAVRVLQNEKVNAVAYAVLRQTIDELEALPFADKIAAYLSVARLTLAALSPPPALSQARRSGFRLHSETDSLSLTCVTPCLNVPR